MANYRPTGTPRWPDSHTKSCYFGYLRFCWLYAVSRFLTCGVGVSRGIGSEELETWKVVLVVIICRHGLVMIGLWLRVSTFVSTRDNPRTGWRACLGKIVEWICPQTLQCLNSCEVWWEDAMLPIKQVSKQQNWCQINCSHLYVTLIVFWQAF